MNPASDYIMKQPKQQQDVILHVVSVVQRCLPEATLEYKWAVPYFYYKKRPFCYLASNVKKGYVDVGFALGFQLKGNQGYLIADNGRNTVKSLRYCSLEEVDNNILYLVIEEAKLLY